MPLPDAPWIRLYVRPDAAPPRLFPGPPAQDWFSPEMYHCLPLTAAGQLGWTLLNAARFEVTWDGRDEPDGVNGQSEGEHVQSRFGHGLVSVDPGFYVRTSPEVDLLVKAVPNLPKDGVTWLEALVETDWFEGSFLVSFRLTRPGLTVVFERDEPLFQLVPYPRRWLDHFRAETVTDGADHATFLASADRWHRDRNARLAPMLSGQSPPVPFDGRYRQGLRCDDSRGPSTHQAKLSLPGFPGLER
jgi:uncharacterized protein DUF6065